MDLTAVIRYNTKRLNCCESRKSGVTHTTLQNQPALKHNKHEEQRDYSSKNKSILLIISNNLLYDDVGCISPCAPPRRPRTHQTLILHEENGQSQSGKGRHSRVEGSKRRRSDLVEVNTKRALQRRWNNGIGLSIVMGKISSMQYCNAAAARDTLSLSCESVCASATNVDP